MGSWDHLVLNVQNNEPSEPNPWKGIRPSFKSPGDTAGAFVELEASEKNVEEPPPNPQTEDLVQEVNLETPDNPRPTFVNAHIKERS